MKCTTVTTITATAALLVLSGYAATVPGTNVAAGLPRMREARPVNLPAQRYHQPAYLQDLSSSSLSHRHRRSRPHSKHHRRSHPRTHHRSARRTHRSHRPVKRSSAHKSLKRFAASTKSPHKAPKRASHKSLYVLIKGKYSWPEASHICWKNGYELAALDARSTGRLVKSMRKGYDGIRKKDVAYWVGAYEKKRKGPLVLRVMAKRKPSIHRLASATSSLDIRVPVLCQVRNPAKLKDPFRYNDRRLYCDAPKTICVIGRKGPECQSHCALGVDKLNKGRKGKHGKQRKYKDSSFSSDSSSSSNSTHTSLYSSSSFSKSSSWSSSYSSDTSSSCSSSYSSSY